MIFLFLHTMGVILIAIQRYQDGEVNVFIKRKIPSITAKYQSRTGKWRYWLGSSVLCCRVDNQGQWRWQLQFDCKTLRWSQPQCSMSYSCNINLKEEAKRNDRTDPKVKTQGLALGNDIHAPMGEVDLNFAITSCLNHCKIEGCKKYITVSKDLMRHVILVSWSIKSKRFRFDLISMSEK